MTYGLSFPTVKLRSTKAQRRPTQTGATNMDSSSRINWSQKLGSWRKVTTMLNWLNKLFRKEKEAKKEEGAKVLVWGVLEGPIYASDIPDAPFSDESVALILKISVGERVESAEFWFDNLGDAYEIVEHFYYKIEPLELNMKEFELVQQ